MAADAKAKTATKKTARRRKAAAKDSQFRNFTPYKPKRGEEYLSEGQLIICVASSISGELS